MTDKLKRQLSRPAAYAIVILLAASAWTAPYSLAQTYPHRPVRMIAPFSEGDAPGLVSRRPVRGQGAQAAGFYKVASASTSSFPTKPIRLIVPFSAGGPADVLARMIGEKLQRSLGQTIVVLNKDGAGTILGVDMAAKASPDGYTLLLGNVAMVINSSAGKRLPYDLRKDLTPVSLAFTQPLILVINPALPINSLNEFIAFARANPGRLKYGSSGVGTSIHLTSELFRAAVGIELTHIPYKGAAPALTDLIGGQIDLMFPGITPVVAHVKTGKLRALGLTSRQRSPALPDLPTMIELGVANFESTGWYGVLVPAGTPQNIVARLNRELVAALNLPDLKERLSSQGGDAISSTPEQFAAFIAAELAKWTDVIRSSNIRVE